MSKGRSLSTRIEELQRRQSELHEIEKQLKARKSAEDRKADAHRKIEIGATVESVLGRHIEHDELHKLFNYLRDQEKRGMYFSKAMNPDTPSAVTENVNPDTPSDESGNTFPFRQTE